MYTVVLTLLGAISKLASFDFFGQAVITSLSVCGPSRGTTSCHFMCGMGRQLVTEPDSEQEVVAK